ncbi:MAG: SMR family transporter [Desulfovibrionaceae bacterium]
MPIEYYLVFSIICTNTLGNVFLQFSKLYNTKEIYSKILVLLGFFSFSVSMYVLYKVVAIMPLFVLYPIITGGTIVATLCTGQYITKERITIKNLIGIFCIIVGIFTLQWGNQ